MNTAMRTLIGSLAMIAVLTPNAAADGLPDILVISYVAVGCKEPVDYQPMALLR
ncbi:MAG: hypothetical protein M3Z35_02415 [Nitrospirota bacterium]|nr:hypothetical protein [Nitrospirota bacterium]